MTLLGGDGRAPAGVVPVDPFHIDTVPAMRVCRDCAEGKPLHQFRKGNGGLMAVCQSCWSKKVAEGKERRRARVADVPYDGGEVIRLARELIDAEEELRAARGAVEAGEEKRHQIILRLLALARGVD